jgi:hypothetical protein
MSGEFFFAGDGNGYEFLKGSGDITTPARGRTNGEHSLRAASQSQ